MFFALNWPFNSPFSVCSVLFTLFSCFFFLCHPVRWPYGCANMRDSWHSSFTLYLLASPHLNSYSMPGSLHRRLRVRLGGMGGVGTQGCTWSNHTPGSMLVQPWKARDKLKDKSTDVDKHNMGSERRQSFTNPFQPQVSMITLLRRVHRGSLDESRLDQEGWEYNRNYICSMCLKV